MYQRPCPPLLTCFSITVWPLPRPELEGTLGTGPVSIWSKPSPAPPTLPRYPPWPADALLLSMLRSVTTSNWKISHGPKARFRTCHRENQGLIRERMCALSTTHVLQLLQVAVSQHFARNAVLLQFRNDLVQGRTQLIHLVQNVHHPTHVQLGQLDLVHNRLTMIREDEESQINK